VVLRRDPHGTVSKPEVFRRKCAGYVVAELGQAPLGRVALFQRKGTTLRLDYEAALLQRVERASMKPGAMATKRIPNAPSSLAQAVVMAVTPDLVAEYALWPALPTRPLN
jgi:hypothetical protein